MNYLLIFVLWLHVLAGVIWIGGMIFILLVLDPSLVARANSRSPLFIERLRIALAVQSRFQFFAARAAELIFITGIFNVIVRGYYSQFQYPTMYLRVLTLKVALFVAMVTLRIINVHLVLSKITSYVSRLSPSEQLTDQIPTSILQLQRKAQYFLIGNAALGLTVLALALILRSL